ncbi:MAG: bifunctional YncE family protein/alkaline phosphatase family protein [Limisphaerales bacterium]
MRLNVLLLALLAFAVERSGGQSTPDAVKWPGLQPDGSVLLHNQWSLRPAGRQIGLGSFPVNVAVHPQGRYAVALNAGYGPHEIMVVDLNTGAVVAHAPLHEAFYGLAFSADGSQLFCGGAGDEVVHRFSFHDGELTDPTEIRVHDKALHAAPCGIAVDRAARRLFVANVWGDTVSEIELSGAMKVTDIGLGPKPEHLATVPVIPPSDFDTTAAEKRAEAERYGNDAEHAFPYACCLDEKRQRLYVSLWAQAAVKLIDLKSGQIVTNWPTEEHPCEMILTRSDKLLYVANASRNTVSVFDTDAGQCLETIWAAFFPGALSGATPNSLALSPDEKTLFVADANVNAVAVFDVSKRRKGRSLGFIPAGWYPTSVRVTPDGRRLLVANGKGVTPKANGKPSAPGKGPSQYIGNLYTGTLSVIDLPRGPQWETQMAAWTADVYRCSPLKAGEAVPVAPPAGNPIPAKVGAAGRIKYVIYIIKENRTYDQVLGDMPKGNGDAKLCLFPERVTPNEHKLAREFVLLDNFYADAEVSANGHEWSMAAYCTDFVEKTWPLNYGHSHNGKFPYPAEGSFPIASPAVGYIWDRAKEAGVSYRSYGEFVTDDQRADQPGHPKVRALIGHIDPLFRGFDLGYSDLKRADRFIAEFQRLEAAGQMPRLQIVRLPNDHTHGATPFFPKPASYVAENDLALGRLVQAVSHSKLWAQTAIFVIEDDAQNGSDHVDAHRTTAFVISPYVRHGVTDSTLYSTTSMVRTMELILGLKPMSQFDAAATPMFDSFQSEPDLRPYEAAPANIDLGEKNTRTAWGSNLKMNFAKEDQADDYLLNEVVWKSVRGADSPMPAPIHAAFVFPRKEGDGD